MPDTILRKPDIKKITGLSDVTIRKMEEESNFPRRFVINAGGRQVGWLESEVQAWIQSRADAR